MEWDMKNFELIWKRDIKELKSTASFYKYKKNGAEILSIVNDDENKVFGITFKTPPKDSTGVAHILEHSVLCGSKKYPVKEPFVELLKGSLHTFLNAMTYPDKTVYPVASQNEKDFYNLIDVYLDAVFNPLLLKEIFHQEGWHLELNKDVPEDSKIVGVVYNEMKGAYSSPDSMLMEYSQQSLFPETPYGFDSGGHPDSIIDLSYEDFINFHRTYYHPSNSRIFFWGNDPEERRLEIVDEYLRNFGQKKVDAKVPLQKRFNKPKEFEYFYPAQQSSKPMITLNWLMDETSLIYINFGLQILEYLLINMDSSILKKNLIESGLGEGLCGVGLEEDIRQMYFSTGLKGVLEKNLKKVEEVIEKTLKDVYKNNFDKDLVDAAINSFEFDLRELNSGSLPRGLAVMVRSLTTWLYKEDPLLCVCFEKPLNLIKQNIAQGERIFEELVAKYFLNNPHRTTIKLIPNDKCIKEIEINETKRVKKVLSRIKDQDKIIEDLKRLKKYQQKEDSEEDLKKIPHLTPRDIPEKENEIPTNTTKTNCGEILFHDISTNNILYLDMAFDLKSVPQKYINYINLIGRMLTEMGTKKHDYVSLDKLIQAKTGGIHHETFISKHIKEKDVLYLIVRSKVMKDKMNHLFDILREIFLEPEFYNKERFLQILMQEKAKLETSLIPLGHIMVINRLKAKLDSSAWVNEQIGGISYFLFLKYLIEETKNNFDKVVEDLKKVFEYIFYSNNTVFNATADDSLLIKAEEFIKTLQKELALNPNKTHKMIYKNIEGNEAIKIPAQVNYVGKGMNLREIDYEFNGAHLVVTKYLRNTYVWNKIRVEGGAYGGFVSLDRFQKNIVFVSYRDPNCFNTLKIYDRAAKFLKDLEISDKELKKAIIGTISDIDTYKLPDAKGLTAMMRYLVGDSEENRHKMRTQILSCTRSHFRTFADYLSTLQDKGVVVIMGDEKKIKETIQNGINIQNVWAVLE